MSHHLKIVTEIFALNLWKNSLVKHLFKTLSSYRRLLQLMKLPVLSLKTISQQLKRNLILRVLKVASIFFLIYILYQMIFCLSSECKICQKIYLGRKIWVCILKSSKFDALSTWRRHPQPLFQNS